MTGDISPSTSEGEIRREWGTLLRLSRRNAGVVYLGYRTGQLALHFDPPEDDVHRVFLTALSGPGLGDAPMVFYHAVVHGETDEGRRSQERRQFGHPFPALDWLHETVPDFDLLETVPVGVPTDGSAGDSAPPATER